MWTHPWVRRLAGEGASSGSLIIDSHSFIATWFYYFSLPAKHMPDYLFLLKWCNFLMVSMLLPSMIVLLSFSWMSFQVHHYLSYSCHYVSPLHMLTVFKFSVLRNVFWWWKQEIGTQRHLLFSGSVCMLWNSATEFPYGIVLS